MPDHNDDVQPREQKTLQAANAYRDALYEMDDGLSKKFEEDGLKAIDTANAAVSALGNLLGVYGASLEGQKMMTAEQFEEAVISTVRRNMTIMRQQMTNSTQTH